MFPDQRTSCKFSFMFVVVVSLVLKTELRETEVSYFLQDQIILMTILN